MNKPTTISWTNSLAHKKLQQRKEAGQPLRLAFLDIDYTLTGEPAKQQLLRNKLEEHGYIIVFVTARTSELCISWATRAKSAPAVQRRPKAKLTLDPTTKKLIEVDPASLPGTAGLLDPDILAPALGGELLIKQENGGFDIDTDYAKSIPYEPTVWGDYGARLVDQLKIGLGALAPQNILANYLEGKIDIAPPESWVQVSFKTAEEKNTFVTTVQELQKKPAPPAGYDPNFFAMIKDTILTDESYPDHTPPSFTVFITHKTVHKLAAVDRVMEAVTQLAIAPASDFEVLLAGDGPSDLRMGLYAAAHTHATFLIPGGARLTRYIKNDNTSFIGHDLTDIPNQLTLHHNQPGIYHFAPTHRTVIIGDEAFPASIGPETTLAWLDAVTHHPLIDQ